MHGGPVSRGPAAAGRGGAVQRETELPLTCPVHSRGRRGRAGMKSARARFPYVNAASKIPVFPYTSTYRLSSLTEFPDSASNAELISTTERGSGIRTALQEVSGHAAISNGNHSATGTARDGPCLRARCAGRSAGVASLRACRCCRLACCSHRLRRREAACVRHVGRRVDHDGRDRRCRRRSHGRGPQAPGPRRRPCRAGAGRCRHQRRTALAPALAAVLPNSTGARGNDGIRCLPDTPRPLPQSGPPARGRPGTGLRTRPRGPAAAEAGPQARCPGRRRPAY